MIDLMRSSLILVLTKGQVTTRYYRFLAKNGGWIWSMSSIHREKSFHLFLNFSAKLCDIGA